MLHIRRLGLIVLASTIYVGPVPAEAVDEGTLYLRREPAVRQLAGGNLSDRSLMPEVPTRDVERTIDQRLFQGEPATEFGRFFTEGVADPMTVAPDNALVRAFLTTGSSGEMYCCAEVTATITRERSIGAEVLGSRTLITSLVPKRPLGAERAILVPIRFDDDPALRDLETGDGLSLSLAVRNRCKEGGARNVNLRYDGRLFASRVDLTSESVELGSGDVDGDGIGDICEPCTLDSPDPFCTCVGSVCGDRDPCTTDGCTDGLGCTFDSLPGIDGLVCRVDAMVDIIDSAEPVDLAPRLSRRRSGLRRSAARNAKLAVKVRRMINGGRPAKKVGRKLRKLDKRLGKFEGKVAKTAGRDKMSSDLRDRLLGLTDGAQSNIEEISGS